MRGTVNSTTLNNGLLVSLKRTGTLGYGWAGLVVFVRSLIGCLEESPLVGIVLGISVVWVVLKLLVGVSAGLAGEVAADFGSLDQSSLDTPDSIYKPTSVLVSRTVQVLSELLQEF